MKNFCNILFCLFKYLKKSIKVHFKTLGCEEPNSSWVVKVNDIFSAKCKICSKTFFIGSMGVKALETNAKGEKHKQSINNTSHARIPGKESLHNSQKLMKFAVVVKGKLPTQNQQTIFTVANNQLAKQAEVKWALEVDMCKQSCSSCDSKSELLTSILPDSNIAKDFTCAQTKCKYIMCFGLAPNFTDLLKNTLEVDHVVSQFD